MNNHLNLVSVVIPVFNGIDYIKSAIQSVLDQDYQPIDLIIVNDGSTDGTKEYLEKLNIENMSVIHTENKGQSSAINYGIKTAKGNLVGYLSADDVFHPELISSVVKEIKNDSKTICIFPNYNLIDEKGKYIKSIYIPEFSKKVMFEKLYCFPGPGAFFYRSHFLKLDGWNKSFFQIPDLEFWFRLIELGNFKRIEKELASFRVHKDSGSVKKISIRRSNETIILARRLLKEGFKSKKMSSSAYMISSFHHLKSGRYLTGLKFILKSAILTPQTLINSKSYKLILKGILK